MSVSHSQRVLLQLNSYAVSDISIPFGNCWRHHLEIAIRDRQVIHSSFTGGQIAFDLFLKENYSRQGSVVGSKRRLWSEEGCGLRKASSISILLFFYYSWLPVPQLIQHLPLKFQILVTFKILFLKLQLQT